jgi:hypothetical protein
LSSPLTGSHSFPPLHTPSQLNNGPPNSHKHKRSVSILSIESDNGAALEKSPATQFSRSRPWGHGRSASLQMPPSRSKELDEFLGMCWHGINTMSGLLTLSRQRQEPG